MVGSQKSPCDLQFQEEIIVWAPQREQKPFIQGEITHDLKSSCTTSYPLILKARAKYFTHQIQRHAASACAQEIQQFTVFSPQEEVYEQ